MTALLLGLLTCGVAAQAEPREILRDKLRSELEAIAGRFEGLAGIQVVDLTTGDRLGVNADLVFPQASAIKIPILLELFRRAERDPALLRRRADMTDAIRTGGSGVLRHLSNGGSALSLEDYAILMILVSDNTATNLLIDALTMDSVNALMRSLGAPGTKLQRKMIRPEASARGEENVSTPREAAELMVKLSRCALPMGAAGCRRVREILEIPKSGPVRSPVPGEVPIAFKPGGLEGVATVWALVGLPGRPYVLTVMTNYGGAGAGGDGNAVIRAASDAAYRYFSTLAGSSPHGVRIRPAPAP